MRPESIALEKESVAESRRAIRGCGRNHYQDKRRSMISKTPSPHEGRRSTIWHPLVSHVLYLHALWENPSVEFCLLVLVS